MGCVELLLGTHFSPDSQAYQGRLSRVHHRGYPLDMFPKTIRDAIIITRYLCLDYLWVDAPNIVQDEIED
jgi:hypothetical protein